MGDESRWRGGSDIPLFEWLVAAIGLVLVTGSIAFLLYEAVRGSEAPPDVIVRVESVSPVEAGYLVRFRAVNRGGQTAAGLLVRGDLKGEAEVVETSEARLDYLPAGSERQGGLYFRENPDRFRLEIRARGYERP
jgi:uncharacterized protein (TIGR02588 family)